MFLLLTDFIYYLCFHGNGLPCFYTYITPDHKNIQKCHISTNSSHDESLASFELRASNDLPGCNHGRVNDDVPLSLTPLIKPQTMKLLSQINSYTISFINISSNQVTHDISNTIIQGSKPNIWLYWKNKPRLWYFHFFLNQANIFYV